MGCLYSSILSATFATFMIAASASSPAQTATSPLRFSSSDARLVQVFDWAKGQALAYVSSGKDPVKYWYEAALPGRHSFCMRDVSHQVMGAQALGLSTQNKSMMTLFAHGMSASKDWASYWEIDRDGKPSSADYLSDDDFWYNLPANFDVMNAALRMYAWTGDSTYIEDPVFLDFYRHTVTDYIDKWQLRPESVLARPRIMNQRLSSGKFVDARGIPGYTENRKDFNLGTDLLAAEYRALRLYSDLLRLRGFGDSAPGFDEQAAGIGHILETRGWDSQNHHFLNALRLTGPGVGKGDAFILYFRAAISPAQRQMAFEEMKRETTQSDPGIEDQSYRPEILLHLNAPEEAYAQILDLSRPNRERREYPEVSYAIIGALVKGIMGVNVVPEENEDADHLLSRKMVVQTLPRLSEHTAQAELDSLPVRQNVVDVRQVRGRSSTMTNVSGPAFTWRASFDGSFRFLLVNGKRVTAKRGTTELAAPVTYVDLVVSPGQIITVAKVP